MINQESNEDETIFDSPSTSTLRPSSSASSDRVKTATTHRLSATRDRSDSSSQRENSELTNKPAPIKVLMVNGKCTETFRSALENSVEECVLQYTGDNAVYVAKSGQTFALPSSNNYQTSVANLREQLTSATTRRSARRRNSNTNSTALPQIGSARNHLSLPVAPQPISSPTRIRHQLVQQKFSLEEDIFEETTIEQFVNAVPLVEAEEKCEPVIVPLIEETSQTPVHTVTSPRIRPTSMTRFSYPLIPSRKNNLSYRDRQRNYRLSDLVMLGPEYFAHVFNLPRSSPTRQQVRQENRRRSSSKVIRDKTTEKYEEFEEIKQDLFHRYLWTQKPQVSCRICPLSNFTRSATFAG